MGHDYRMDDMVDGKGTGYRRDISKSEDSMYIQINWTIYQKKQNEIMTTNNDIFISDKWKRIQAENYRSCSNVVLYRASFVVHLALLGLSCGALKWIRHAYIEGWKIMQRYTLLTDMFINPRRLLSCSMLSALPFCFAKNQEYCFVKTLT